MTELEAKNIRFDMELAWRAIELARNTSWKSLQIEVILVAGLIGVQHIDDSFCVTILGLVALAGITWFGIKISLRQIHPLLQNDKRLKHWRKELNLKLDTERDDKLARNERGQQQRSLLDVLWRTHWTSVYVVWMQLVILGFAILYLLIRGGIAVVLILALAMLVVLAWDYHQEYRIVKKIRENIDKEVKLWKGDENHEEQQSETVQTRSHSV